MSDIRCSYCGQQINPVANTHSCQKIEDDLLTNPKRSQGIWALSGDDKRRIIDLFDYMKKEEIKKLLLLVMNALAEFWDDKEMSDPDQSTEKWLNYKCIRNNERNVIRKIVKTKGIEL